MAHVKLPGIVLQANHAVKMLMNQGQVNDQKFSPKWRWIINKSNFLALYLQQGMKNIEIQLPSGLVHFHLVPSTNILLAQ